MDCLFDGGNPFAKRTRRALDADPEIGPSYRVIGRPVSFGLDDLARHRISSRILVRAISSNNFRLPAASQHGGIVWMNVCSQRRETRRDAAASTIVRGAPTGAAPAVRGIVNPIPTSLVVAHVQIIDRD